MLNLLFLISVSLSGVMGGPRDRPMIFRAGGTYGVYLTEDYWTKVFKDSGGGADLAFDAPTGAYFRIDMVLARFTPPEKYKYAPTEKLRKAIVFIQDFSTIKAFHVGYNLGMYNIKASNNALGEVKWQLFPMGISFGTINGMSPWHGYSSIGGGMLIVKENWKLNKILTSQVSDTNGVFLPTKEEDQTENGTSGWYGMAEIGMIRQLRGPIAIDFFVGYNFFLVNYTKGTRVPIVAPPTRQEIIQQAEIGLGLIFAFPWYSEKTIW